LRFIKDVFYCSIMSRDISAAALTTEPIGLPEKGSHLRPEWIRLPPVGQRCPLTGLSRSTINTLILASPENGHKPPVRSICLRKPGRVRGARLIHLQSLLDHLDSMGSGAGGERLS
jgi:hypothetical protein